MPDLHTISQAILTKAAERGEEKTTCPSEIAHSLFPQGWRSHMKEIREVAAGLQKMGKIIITQKGKPVDMDAVKGPIRIGMKKA